MADVFVSYSRRDDAFVGELREALRARGKDVWVDVEGIRDAEVFPAAIRSAIESSDAFAFVISPDSVASTFCEQEVRHAVDSHKLIVPLLHRAVADEDVPDAVRERNWIPFEGDFDGSVDRVVAAVDTDLDWVHDHTRWLLKARDWEAGDRDRSHLLRGSELAAAERWLAGEAGKQPAPTALQREFVLRSRAGATRRLRALAAAMALALAVAVGLGIVALTQRNTARSERQRAVAAAKVARSRELAAVSQAQLAFDPELAALLGVQAVRTSPTPQAMFALRRSLDASALQATLLGHKGGVSDTAFSPDGKLLATSSAEDASVRIWDVATHRLVRRLGVGQANGVAFTPDGTTLAVGRYQDATALIDTRDWRVRRTLGPAELVDFVSYGAHGRDLVIGGGVSVGLYDSRTARAIRRWTVPDLQRAALSPDGRLLAAAATHELLVFDARTGRRVLRLPGAALDVAFFPDGRLAYGAADLTVHVVDPRTGRQGRVLGAHARAPIDAVVVSPDGRTVAVGSSDGSARLFDAATGRLERRLAGHRCCVAGVAFSPDGRLLATTSRDHTVKLWSTRTNVLQQARVGRGPVDDLSFARDGWLASASAGGGVMLWRPGSRAPPRPVAAAGRAGVVALSPDGRLLAAPTHAGIALIDPATGRVTRTLPADAGVGALAFDGAGALLATGGEAGGSVLDVAGARPVAELDARLPVSGVAFEPGGRVLDAALQESGNGAVTLSAARGGRQLRLVTAPNAITSLVASPDGRLVVGATTGDPTVKVWDGRTMRLLRLLAGHTGEVTDAAFSPRGRLVATASADGTVRVWDALAGTQLRVIEVAHPVSVAFTPDGSRLAIGDGRGTVSIWDACSGCENPRALLAIARTRVTRSLTPVERATFLALR